MKFEDLIPLDRLPGVKMADIRVKFNNKNGKRYVGSATSKKGMLLSRWSTYAKNGHGGNKDLKDLVDREGFEYVKENFTYSILENYNAKVDDAVILQREAWWKVTLMSKEFGYNKN